MTEMDKLIAKLREEMVVGGGYADVSSQDLECLVAEIERSHATIAQLRAVAGAVSVEGHSYADIRKDIRGIGPNT